LNRFTFIFLFFVTFRLYSQSGANLVYNGDFEIYDTCPTNVSIVPPVLDPQIEHCLGWKSAAWGSSDFFNSCQVFPNPVAVPKNTAGYQWPQNGEGYCGFGLYLISQSTSGHYREYIQGNLTQTFEEGKTYKFGTYISKAHGELSISKLGVSFSSTAITQNDWKPFNNVPYTVLTNGGFLNDTANWVLLEAEYIATGGEKYITIGNFSDSLSTDTFRVVPYDVDTHDDACYYYIDGFYASEKEELIIENNWIFTPNGDGINDLLYFKLENKTNISFTIFNRWGVKVFETKKSEISWDGRTTAGIETSDGVYYFVLSFQQGTKEKTIKGFMQLMR